VGEVHLSEIISSVELYCFNIGGGYFQTQQHTVDVKKATFLYILVMVKIYIGCCLFTTIRCPYEQIMWLECLL
jgi:hypothetical protein